MSAVTPNMASHADLPELASRFVNVDELPWEKSQFPGIEYKTLLVDEDTGMLTALLRMAPGARLPDHEHTRIEQTFVLEGTLVDDDGGGNGGKFRLAARGKPPQCAYAGWRPHDRVLYETQPVLCRGWARYRHAGPRFRGDLGLTQNYLVVGVPRRSRRQFRGNRAEMQFQDIRCIVKFSRCTVKHDTPRRQDMNLIRHGHSKREVLLYQQD